MTAILLGAACAKETPAQQEQQTVLHESRAVFYATLEEGTKTAFDGKKCSWLETDEIAVSDGSVTSICEIQSIENGVATFVPKEGQPEVDMGASSFTAVYPAKLMTEGLGSVTIAEPGEETASLPLGAVSMNARLAFRNICSAVKFSLTSNTAGAALKELSVSADKPLAGKFSIVDGAAVVNSDGAYSIGISCPDGIALNGTGKVLYIPVPAGEYGQFDIVVRTVTGVKKTFRMKEGESLKLERSTIYSKSVAANDLDVCDFREEGPANCYIAAAAGKYVFAPVRADGSAIDGIAGVKVLWRCNNTTTAPADGTIVTKVSYTDGAVQFETDGNQGNALIAAYDAAGTILWSWHIWRTNESPKDITVAKGVTMDRFLGALSATPGDLLSVGLLYQYGRKDPFPGRAVEGNTLAAFQGTAYTEEAGPVDLATSVKNPAVRYYRTDSNFWTTADARPDAEWDGDSKTFSDPCPYGYRIPLNDLFGAADKATLATIFAWDSANVGCSFNGGKAWYPATGQLAPKAKNLNSGTAICFSWSRNKNGNGNPFLLDLRSAGINGWAGGGAAASGFAVRCVKE